MEDWEKSLLGLFAAMVASFLQMENSLRYADDARYREAEVNFRQQAHIFCTQAWNRDDLLKDVASNLSARLDEGNSFEDFQKAIYSAAITIEGVIDIPRMG